jgi:hypothetical protein
MELKSQGPNSKKNWYVKDMGKTYGPLTLKELEDMVKSNKVTPLARYREATWERWEPIFGYYVAEAQEDMHRTAENLPGEIRKHRYMGLFYVGVVAFIAGLLFFGSNIIISTVLFILGFSVEVMAIYWDGKYTQRFIKGLGNIFTYCLFIVIEIVVILLFWRIMEYY